MENSEEVTPTPISVTRVDLETGITSETLFSQTFAGEELIFSTQREYQQIEPVDSAFSQIRQITHAASVERTVATSEAEFAVQPGTSSTPKKMARTKKTLNIRQKKIFEKHGFTQQLVDEVMDKKLSFPWTVEHIRKYVLDHNIRHPKDQKEITAKGIETPVTPKPPRKQLATKSPRTNAAARIGGGVVKRTPQIQAWHRGS